MRVEGDGAVGWGPLALVVGEARLGVCSLALSDCVLLVLCLVLALLLSVRGGVLVILLLEVWNAKVAGELELVADF